MGAEAFPPPLGWRRVEREVGGVAERARVEGGGRERRGGACSEHVLEKLGVGDVLAAQDVGVRGLRLDGLGEQPGHVLGRLGLVLVLLIRRQGPMACITPHTR